jgi:hypothetical protein
MMAGGATDEPAMAVAVSLQLRRGCAISAWKVAHPKDIYDVLLKSY